MGTTYVSSAKARFCPQRQAKVALLLLTVLQSKSVVNVATLTPPAEAAVVANATEPTPIINSTASQQPVSEPVRSTDTTIMSTATTIAANKFEDEPEKIRPPKRYDDVSRANNAVWVVSVVVLIMVFICLVKRKQDQDYDELEDIVRGRRPLGSWRRSHDFQPHTVGLSDRVELQLQRVQFEQQHKRLRCTLMRLGLQDGLGSLTPHRMSATSPQFFFPTNDRRQIPSTSTQKIEGGVGRPRRLPSTAVDFNKINIVVKEEDQPVETEQKRKFVTYKFKPKAKVTDQKQADVTNQKPEDVKSGKKTKSSRMEKTASLVQTLFKKTGSDTMISSVSSATAFKE